MTTTQTPESVDSLFNRSKRLIRLGAFAGLMGGLAFGVVMVVSNMLPMVGMLIGQNDANIGFAVHIVISAIIGAGFGIVMAVNTAERPIITVLIGILYGFFWWILGGLILMPILLGMPGNVFVIGQMQIDSLIGHLMYGLTIGVVINWLPT
jgi:uncharacterized membrane protein YagU involved in acid resistance